jgi:hypothetical protein
MQTAQFPMVLTHRSNPHAQVVVANAEQLAEIPAEYLPETIDGTPAVLTAAAAIPGVNLEAGTSTAVDAAEQAERRQSLDEAVDEFTTHVQAETAKIDTARAQLEQDRATLGQQTAALNEQMEALARERAEFEAQRATTTSTAGTGDIAGDTGTASAAAEGAATGETPAAPAAPAKRTRAAAKEGA